MDVEVWDDAHKRTARGVLKFVRSARVDGVVSRTCAGRVAGRSERCEAKEVICAGREKSRVRALPRTRSRPFTLTPFASSTVRSAAGSPSFSWIPSLTLPCRVANLAFRRRRISSMASGSWL